jgi:hypothetical protein
MVDNRASDGRRSGRGAVAGRRRHWQRWRMRPKLRVLEDRRLLSTLTVTSAADSAPADSPDVHTLRWAVDQANAATTASSIEIELGTSPATITLLEGQLELDNPAYATTIYDGPGERAVTISGNGASRVFQIDGGVTASISGLLITGGSAYSGGGLANFGGNLTLANCTLSGNSATGTYGFGGGVYSDGGMTTLTNCAISDNAGTF